MKKTIKFVLLISLIAIALLIFCLKAGQKQKEGATQAPLWHKAEFTEKKAYPLVPANPDDYGMIITERKRSVDEEGWKQIISAKIKALKSDFPEDVWAEANALIAEDAQKTEEKIKQIDEALEKIKSPLYKGLPQEELEEKIERLIILRSIANELKARQGLNPAENSGENNPAPPNLN